jgi:predicted phage gp36 major capsid-like protein
MAIDRRRFSMSSGVDRIGLSIEIVPHIFGSSNRFPIGARGLYAWWRVGSGVTAPAAARHLEVK